MSAEIAVRLEGISKRYGPVVALEKLDLDIRRGEFLTLLGPSGSGKSTTLMLIAGFESPTTGEIYLDGRPVSRVPPHRRRIGIVFQSYALFPHLTVFENIAFALRNLRWPRARIDARVGELLKLIQLEGLAGRRPAQLSGGQQQRVALARALAFEPSVLLLDEPVGALDRKLREQMLGEFRRIHATLGTTMIYVTHDQEEALVMSDRIAVMNQGRVVRLGTPRELYEDPRDLFVADFLGETNLIPARVLGPDQVVAEPGGWRIRVRHTEASGAAVSVAVRPEKLVLGDVRPDWNAVDATVEEALYLGETTRYRLRARTGHVLCAKRQNRGSAGEYPVGARVTAGWDPVDGRLLPPRAEDRR